jgi:uncharacterized protein (TIGR00255 family)
MTGFAQVALEEGQRRVEVVIQGWNHRHLDVVVRLPEELRGLDAAIREKVAAHVARGRCEVTVRTGSSAPRRLRVQVEQDAVEALRGGARELVRAGLLDSETLGLADVLRVPQLLSIEVESEAWSERDGRLVDDALAGALQAFVASREGEGARLGLALGRLRGEMVAVTDRLEARRREVAGRLESALRARLDDLLPGGAQAVPPERLAQEVVLLVERGDVQEELDRLRSHLQHLAEVFQGQGTIGKRLEFLAQEILRELNTLGAKSRDAELTRLVVDAKVLCEQVREQIQNVE